MSPSTGAAARGERQAARPESAETQTRILDAAEALFIERGFAATSVRAVAGRAGVNLAAAHYHFGSKEGLLSAAIHRRVRPVNEARVAGLDALQARTPQPSAREILTVFLAPLAADGVPPALPRLFARLYGEPPSLSKPLIEREFTPTAGRFLAALAGALPRLDADELRWRFHFVIGAMIHLFAFERPPDFGREAAALPRGGALGALVEFAIAGLERAPEVER